MKTGTTVSIIAVAASLTSLSLAQEGAPGAAPEAPAGAAAPAAPPPAAGPPPAAAPAPGPAPAGAPEAAPQGGAHTHDGFFFRMGLNFGPIIMKENLEAGGNTSPDVKYSGLHTGFDLMFGGSPMPGLAIGGALIAGWTKNPKVDLGTAGSVEPKGTLIFSGLGVFGDYYLNPHEGLHFLGMLGFSSVDFIPEEGSNSGDSPSGLMFGVGAGYDFWVGNEWSIGPFARILYSSMSAEQGGVTDKVSYLYPSIGIAFTLH